MSTPPSEPALVPAEPPASAPPPVLPPSMETLTCPACGTPAMPGARFCFHCGAPLATAAISEAAAERRVVTVLFGDLSDFTAWAEDLDPERVGVVTDRVLAGLAHAVNDVGGHVDKLTGDGIMAVFGAPTAHEDDAERAVRAAARMQAAVRRLVAEEVGGGRRLGLRVGLNTGEVLAGVQAALAYTVVGDTVNTASRLSDVAGVGAVVAGRDTASATMGMASWRALPPLRLKGKRELVTAYELVALRARSAARLGLGDEAPFVGREAELGLLIGRLLDAVDREVPESVLVTGDAGIGKTRLAQELGRFAGELPGSRVLWGRCVPYGEGRDLAPLAEVVRTACGIADGDPPEVATQRVRRAVARLEHPAGGGSGPAGVGDRVGDRLLELLGLSEPDRAEGTAPRAGAAPGTDGEADEDATVVALAALLCGLAAQGPLLLVVDDLQWASDELLDLLTAVGSRLTGQVLLLGVGRSELLEARDPRHLRGWWVGLPEPEILPVVPLEEPATDRLLRAYLGGGRLEEAARQALLDRAQGNPFFLAELLHLLVDRGLLRHEPLTQTLAASDDVGPAALAAAAGAEPADAAGPTTGPLRLGESGWVLAGGLPTDVLPAGVQAVLAARIDGLDVVSRAVLRDAAVVGTRFSAAALVSLAEGADDSTGSRADLRVLRDRVRHGLDQLVERQIVVPVAAGPAPNDSAAKGPGVGRVPDGSYLFRHQLTRDVAYAGIPKADRARRHARVARWAVASMPGPLAEVDAVVSAQAERAVTLATEMALPPGDPAWSGRGLGFTTLVRLGQSALFRDDPAAVGLLERALRLAGAADPASPTADRVGASDDLVVPARVAYAEALARVNRLEEAQGQLEVALRYPEPGVRAGALAILGDVRRRAGDDAGATRSFVQAIAAAGDAGLDRVASEAIRQLGLLDFRRGRLRAAEDRFAQALELAARVGDRRGQGWALQHLAWSQTTRGDYVLADATLAQAQDVFGSFADVGGLSWCAGTEALVRLLQGRLMEARELARALVPVAEAAQERFGVAACRTIDAMAAAELGQLDVAEAEAATAYAIFVELGDAWGVPLALVARALVARGRGEPERAAVLLEEAVTLAEDGDQPTAAVLALVILGLCHLDRAGYLGAVPGARTALDRQAVAAAREAARRAFEVLDRLDIDASARIGAQVLLAQTLRADGDLPAARALLEQVTREAGPALLFPRRQAFAHLAGVLVDLGEPAAALAAARSALAVPAEDVRARVVALRALGAALAASGEHDRAVDVLREALEAARATQQRSEVAGTELALSAALRSG